MSADPQWRLSGGAGNSDPNAALGGIISSTQVGAGDGNLFDDVTGDESSAGDTEYRGVYVYNNGADSLLSAVVWIVDESDASADIELAPADEGLNATMETIGNESTAPSGPTFAEYGSKGAGLSIGTIPAGQRFGIWVKRAVAGSTGANAAATFTLRVEGDSV